RRIVDVAEHEQETGAERIDDVGVAKPHLVGVVEFELSGKRINLQVPEHIRIVQDELLRKTAITCGATAARAWRGSARVDDSRERLDSFFCTAAGLEERLRARRGIALVYHRAPIEVSADCDRVRRDRARWNRDRGLCKTVLGWTVHRSTEDDVIAREKYVRTERERIRDRCALTALREQENESERTKHSPRSRLSSRQVPTR